VNREPKHRVPQKKTGLETEVGTKENQREQENNGEKNDPGFQKKREKQERPDDKNKNRMQERWVKKEITRKGLGVGGKKTSGEKRPKA